MEYFPPYEMGQKIDSSSSTIFDKSKPKKVPIYRQEPKPETLVSTKDDIYELEYDSSEVKPIKKRQKKTKIKAVPAKIKMNRPVLRQRILPVILEEDSYSDEEQVIDQIESEDEMPQSNMAKRGPGTMEVADESNDELLEEKQLTCSTLKDATKLGRCSRNKRATADESTKFGQTTPLLKKVYQKSREEVKNNPGLVAENNESKDEEPQPK